MSRQLLVVAVVFLAAPSAAFAHAIGIEAKLKGDRVVVEAYFDDDTPAADARITVTGEDGTSVASGKTDLKGNWSFPVPSPGKYRVEVNAGDGHRAKTTITIPGHPAPPASDTIAPTRPTLEAEVVSDGPTREETTGSRRWLMAGAGLALIGLLTWGARLAARLGSRRPTSEAAQ